MVNNIFPQLGDARDQFIKAEQEEAKRMLIGTISQSLQSLHTDNEVETRIKNEIDN